MRTKTCRECGERLKGKSPFGLCEDCARLYPQPTLESSVMGEQYDHAEDYVVELPSPKAVTCMMCGKKYGEMPEECECGENYWDTTF